MSGDSLGLHSFSIVWDLSVKNYFTLADSSKSLWLSRAWLILNTIQSKRALYRDLAMESRTVSACKREKCQFDLIIKTFLTYVVKSIILQQHLWAVNVRLRWELLLKVDKPLDRRGLFMVTCLSKWMMTLDCLMLNIVTQTLTIQSSVTELQLNTRLIQN